MENEALSNSDRRDFLVKLTSVVGGAGVAATCVPFVASMNPSSDVLAKAETEVDLTGIPPGGLRTVAWQGKPVFILRRTPDEIKEAQASNGGFDPEPDSQRVKNPEWLVVVGVCTHMGCVPNKEGPGWTCHCHGSQYDDSGRVTRGPAPKNLEVPPYHFVSENKIVIGKVA
ncbi:ubiquinol-cytochrome c reductase iron-sulfur subunit [Sideroxydans sp. CL21]|jgi:ubiquinol-cytochrome c reductase iron-sulfur subunit|uniref:ubiquinol-cytochrome c reductase iron-sulfur subunit n=1 Tax=Sideroxydans sp. CL21 TaxID=2600596 RepID=UPI0012A84C78|nr:ubiquinol-cytochrome c reductase iron-sulfur subunit [Sideroxydans sp. CL21]VVC85603.1 Ubiquinol-cytochrome C reductase iron-sulfur subunit (EC 1.10.2.2) [Sideroxydans sp. CL21]